MVVSLARLVVGALFLFTKIVYIKIVSLILARLRLGHARHLV